MVLLCVCVPFDARFFLVLCARVLSVQTSETCQRTEEEEEERTNEKKENVDNCNMFPSTNIRLSHTHTHTYHTLTASLNIVIDDMQEERVMWILSNAQRTFSAIYGQIHALSVFYYFIYSSFIPHSTSFFMHSACEHLAKRNWHRNTRNNEREREEKISLSMGFIVKHISTRRTQTNKCVIFSIPCVLRCIACPPACLSRRKKRQQRRQPTKNRIECFFSSMKIYSKSLCESLSTPTVSANLPTMPPYIAISTFRLHRVNIPISPNIRHIISVMWMFSIYILNKKKGLMRPEKEKKKIGKYSSNSIKNLSIFI